MSLLGGEPGCEAFETLTRFRAELYASTARRADTLFELTDALLCSDGPVRTLVDLALAPEHRRGPGALHGGLNRAGSSREDHRAAPRRACPPPRHIQQHPPATTTHAPVPVAYVLIPPGATAKALAVEFARYLGIPVTGRMTETQITDAVCHTYNRAGVRLGGDRRDPPAQPPHHHRRGNRRPAARPHRTYQSDVRVRGHRRDRDRPVLRGAGLNSPVGLPWWNAGCSQHASEHATPSVN